MYQPNTSTSSSQIQLVGAQSGDGFEDLEQLDSNGDGVINSSDPGFSQLDIWIDQDSNGSVEAGELHTLESLGISSIDVSSAASSQDINGNSVSATGTFTIVSGGAVATRQFADVNFLTSDVDSRYIPPASFSYNPGVFYLPDLAGYGTAPDLWASMSLDSTLFDDVGTLVQNAPSMSFSDFDQAFQQLLFQWVGAEGIDPESQGNDVNAQHLAVDYAFYGINAAQNPLYQTEPNYHSGPIWESIYNDILSSLEVRFLSQVAISEALMSTSQYELQASPWTAFSTLALNLSTDSLSLNMDATVGAILSDDPGGSSSSGYYESMTSALSTLKYDFFDGDEQSLVAAVLGAAGDLGASSLEAELLSGFEIASVSVTNASSAIKP